MRILLVHSSPLVARRVARMLAATGAPDLEVTDVRRLSDGLKRLRLETFDAALIDPGPADSRGLENMRRVQESMTEVPIVVLDLEHSDETAAALHSRTEGTLLLESIRRAIERKQAERRMAHLAYHDALTQLPNRLLLVDRLEQDIARSRRANRPLGVLFLDLDGFKQVNDVLGHSAGDRLLQAVAARLIEQVRASDTVARVGGDEFVLVLASLSGPRDAARVSAKLHAALSKPVPIEGRTPRVSASIGIAFYPKDGTTPETLLRAADRAMYRRKRRRSESPLLVASEH